MSQSDDPFGYRFAFEENLRHGCSSITLGTDFANCVASGTELPEELRKIGFDAVSSACDTLEELCRQTVDEVADRIAMTEQEIINDPFYAAGTIARIISDGVLMIGLAAIQPDIFQPLLHDFDIQLTAHQQQILTWDAPAIESAKDEAAPALRGSRWWLKPYGTSP